MAKSPLEPRMWSSQGDFKVPDETLPRELQVNHPGAVAVDPGSASTYQVVLRGGEVAGGEAGMREDAGGGTGVDQHGDERQLVFEPQEVGGCPIRDLGGFLERRNGAGARGGGVSTRAGAGGGLEQLKAGASRC